MAETVKCPGYQAVLRLRAEMAGNKIKCPRCAAAVEVPAAGGITAKARQRSKEVEEEVLDEVEDEEEAPVQRRSKWEPCPRCGAEDARRVKWTIWGSFYFTALFQHVRCRECGCGYNGRSGRSNLLPAIVCVSVPLVGLLGVIGVIIWILHSRGWL